MEHRQLGRSGLRVSRLALGTMTWGLDTDADEAAEQLSTFHEAGGTLIDTADVYQDGHTEEILGDLLTTQLPRDEIVLATKAVARRKPGPFGGGASRGALLTALDGSLRRLRTDHVDLWQLHAWDPSVPLDETLSAIDTAVTSGRVRYAGISNYAGWQLATAATHHGLGLLAWAPLGRGVLTGKYRNATPPDSRGATSHLASYVEHHRTERAARIVQAVLTAAEGLGSAPVHVALAWVRDRPGVTAPILGARTNAQLKTALAAEDLTLPPA
ncbi:aldo/keto reductase, partial [Saccharopolyspora elongata]